MIKVKARELANLCRPVAPSIRPVSQASSRSIPAPACDTTPVPSALTLTRPGRLLRFTCGVPFLFGDWTLSKSQFSLQDRHFVLFSVRVAPLRAKHPG